MDQEPKHLDAASLKALAHPLRLGLLRALRTFGPDTASGLARRLGESSGATSYHLRMLERHGFVEEDATRGSGRDRWWRSVHRTTMWSATQFDDDPGAREALDVVSRLRVQNHADLLERWLTGQRTWPDAWREAAIDDDYLLHLPPDRLAALGAELRAVAARYAREAGGPGAEHVTLILYGLPQRDREDPR